MEAQDPLANSALYKTNAKKYLKYVKPAHALNSEVASFLHQRINDADKRLAGKLVSAIDPLRYLDAKWAYILSLPLDDPRQRIPLDKIELTKESLAHLKDNPHARMVYYYGFIMEKNIKRLLQIKLKCRIGKRGKLDKLCNLEQVSKEEFYKKVGTIDPDELNNIRLEASRNFAQTVLNRLR